MDDIQEDKAFGPHLPIPHSFKELPSDMDDPNDIKRALGYIITGLGGEALNVPTT